MLWSKQMRHKWLSTSILMDVGNIVQTVIHYRLVLLVLLFLTVLLAACNSFESEPTCTGNLQPYKRKCLSNMAIEYVGCTEGRGISPTTEFSGGVGGTFKVVADASLNLAYKQTQQENTPVALQIIKDCLEVAKSNSSASDPEQSIATDYQRQVDQSLQQWQQQQVNQTSKLTLSSASARKGEQVTVNGTQFWPNVMVDIRVHATLVSQVKADEKGAFSAVITVLSSTPAPGFDTTIVATGQTSAKSAEAPFHTTP
jgi:hypothetical protein